MPDKQLTGIILAGGKGNRIGNINKGLISFKKQNYIEKLINVMQPMVQNILISTNTHVYDYLGYEIVHDEIPNTGPAGGIASTLKRTSTERNLIVACDLPLINTGLLKYLYENSERYDITIPEYKGTIQQLCGFYNKKVGGIFDNFIRKGVFSIKEIIKHTNYQILNIPETKTFAHKNLLLNINTPEDLDTLNKHSHED